MLKHYTNRDLLIGPARLPLFTLVVMSPATIKQALALNVGPVQRFAPGFSAIAQGMVK